MKNLLLLLIIFSSMAVFGQSITLSPNISGTTTEGKLYYDNGTHLFRYWNGAAWTNLASGGGVVAPLFLTSTSAATITGENSGGAYPSTGTYIGVLGNATQRYPSYSTTVGVKGENHDSGYAHNYGVWGEHFSDGRGVYGKSALGTGVYGSGAIGGYFTSTSNYALITEVGYVGIGTITPTAKLDVAGKVKILESTDDVAVDATNSSATNPTMKATNNTNLGPAIDIMGGIKVSGTNKAAFKVVTSAIYISTNKFGILNTTMANASNDILVITYEYTGGSYLNKQFASSWNGGNWEIHLTDGSAMPVGITFNILVIKQ